MKNSGGTAGLPGTIVSPTLASCSDEEAVSVLLRTPTTNLYFQKLPNEIFAMVLRLARDVRLYKSSVPKEIYLILLSEFRAAQFTCKTRNVVRLLHRRAQTFLGNCCWS